MPRLSKQSREKLATCHPDLQRLFERVIEEFDFTVIEGHRTLERQKELVAGGASKTMKSKHLEDPSRACDIAPYPVDWNDVLRFRELAAVVLRTAADMGIRVRWGGSFKNFFDGPHYELME